MSSLTLIGNTPSIIIFGKLHNWYNYESLLHLPICWYKWKGRFTDILENDWLVMMPLDGGAVSFYHVTL